MLNHDINSNYEFSKTKECGKYYLQPFENILVVYNHLTPILSTLKYLILGIVAGNGIILNP